MSNPSVDSILADWYDAGQVEAAFPFDSLEDLIASREGFGLRSMTPLQRAICRIVEGRPLGDLAGHPHVKEAVGGVADVDGQRPQRVVLVAGIRTFKSMLAAALGLWASQTCDLARLGPGEVPRYSIVSIKLDLAQVIFRHLVGVLQARGKLRSLLLGQPTSDTVRLKHPSGHPVEIKCVAGARAGASLVARWSIGAAFDEAPRMVGASDGVINLDDARTAVVGRLLPGAQITEIGSPWASYGPIYDVVNAHHGTPTKDVCVIKGRADWLNPVWWTPERIEDVKRRDPVAYKTDVLAEFADADEALIPGAAIDASLYSDTADTAYNPARDYVAAMDPATRGNGWTLVICDRVGTKKRVVYSHEWIGTPTKPLRPKDVLAEAARVCRSYGLTWAYTDQWAADAIVDIAAELDEPLHLLVEDWTAKNKTEAFLALRDAITNGTVEFHAKSTTLVRDLRLVKKRVTQAGPSIVLPRTPDGRHADYAPAIARALHRWIEDERELPPEEAGERANWEAHKRQSEAARKLAQKQAQPWWATGGEAQQGGPSDPFDDTIDLLTPFMDL